MVESFKIIYTVGVFNYILYLTSPAKNYKLKILKNPENCNYIDEMEICYRLILLILQTKRPYWAFL